MQAEETKMILRYFGGIKAQLDDVNIELAELRDRYNPIKGIRASRPASMTIAATAHGF